MRRLKCYEGVGEQIAVLTDDGPERETLCARAHAGAEREACRYGARLPASPPEGLPRERRAGDDRRARWTRAAADG